MRYVGFHTGFHCHYMVWWEMESVGGSSDVGMLYCIHHPGVYSNSQGRGQLKATSKWLNSTSPKSIKRDMTVYCILNWNCRLLSQDAKKDKNTMEYDAEAS